MKRLLTFLILFFSMFILTGCGIEGSVTAVSIDFTEDVFYVDLNVRTLLTYKVFPSTAKNITVSYDYEIDTREEEYKTFPFDGSVTVKDSRFREMTVFIQTGELTDTCLVKLKEYPLSIGFYNDKQDNAVMKSDKIESGLIYSLNLMGDYDGDLRPLNDNYIYKVTSSNPSVVAVEDEQKLLVRSTGRKGNSKITVEILKSNLEPVLNGIDKLEASIELVCDSNVSSSFVAFNGTKRINDGVQIEIVPEIKSYELEAFFFDKDSVLLDAEYEIFVSREDIISTYEQENKKYLKLNRLPVEGESRLITITVQTKLLSEAHVPYKITFTIKVADLT